MVRISAHDSDRTAFSSPETTPDSTKMSHGHGHETVLQGALLPVPDPEPLLLPALEPATPVRLRAVPSRTSLRKKASQVFEFSKASVASLRSAAMGVASSPGIHTGVPPVPPLPPVPPIPHAYAHERDCAGRSPDIGRSGEADREAYEEGAESAAVKSLKKMRSRSQLGLARVTVEVHSGRARDAGRIERVARGEDE